MMHYIYIETGGSGGAIFRQIYADFLGEAGHLMDHDGILKASEEFKEIVKTWRDVANHLLPQEYPALREIRETQWTINETLESKGLAALDEVRKLSERIPALLGEAAKSEIQEFSKFIPEVQSLLIEVGQMETQTLSALQITL